MSRQLPQGEVEVVEVPIIAASMLLCRNVNIQVVKQRGLVISSFYITSLNV